MKRSELKNKANKSKLKEDYDRYKKQKNFVVNLNKRKKKSFFNKISQETHQKSFWNTCKAVFPGKSGKHQDNIMLEKDGQIISDDTTVADILNNYFVNIFKDLNITPWKS